MKRENCGYSVTSTLPLRTSYPCSVWMPYRPVTVVEMVCVWGRNGKREAEQIKWEPSECLYPTIRARFIMPTPRTVVREEILP